MNPFSVSVKNTEEEKNTCTRQSWQNIFKPCAGRDTGGGHGELQTHAHSLTLPISSASLPSRIHSLPPLPKRKDQALTLSEPHIGLAGGGQVTAGKQTDRQSAGPRPQREAQSAAEANASRLCLLGSQ